MEILTGEMRSRPSEPRRRDSVETPAQPVRLGGSRHWRAVRESLGVAVGVLVVIAGLGLAGGHLPNGLSGADRAGTVLPSGSPDPTNATTPSPHFATPATTIPGPTPQVTPVVPCSAARATSPDPMLAIAGVGRYEGQTTYTSDLMPGIVETTDANPDLSILADAVVALVFIDRRCALAWDISMDDGRVFAHQDNPRLDPAHAAQNEFPLHFGARPYSATLTATFRFATGESRTVWHITIEPFQVPTVALLEASGPISDGEAPLEAARGCAMQLSLKNGAVLADACVTELPSTAVPVFRADPGAVLTFRSIDAMFEAVDDPIRCGHVDGSPPTFDPDLTCVLARPTPTDPLQFRAPVTPGQWLIALSGCAIQDGNRACGAWFVTVDTTHGATSG